LVISVKADCYPACSDFDVCTASNVCQHKNNPFKNV